MRVSTWVPERVFAPGLSGGEKRVRRVSSAGVQGFILLGSERESF